MTAQKWVVVVTNGTPPALSIAVAFLACDVASLPPELLQNTTVETCVAQTRVQISSPQRCCCRTDESPTITLIWYAFFLHETLTLSHI